jgi:hypothetical protein
MEAANNQAIRTLTQCVGLGRAQALEYLADANQDEVAELARIGGLLEAQAAAKPTDPPGPELGPQVRAVLDRVSDRQIAAAVERARLAKEAEKRQQSTSPDGFPDLDQ